MEKLKELEQLSMEGKIDLYYGDETHACNEGYVPYGLEYMEDFSFQIRKKTFVVLDNARIHKAKDIQERIPYWHKRGLYIFFLPPYSPHLNIAETMWRKLKKEWLNPEDYLYKDNLFYAVNRCMATLGHSLMIKFSKFNIN